MLHEKNYSESYTAALPDFVKLAEAYGCVGIRASTPSELDDKIKDMVEFDGFWELGLNSWDTSAGVLIVREAGGRVIAANGKSFDILKNKSLISGNKIIVKEILKNIKVKEF